MELLFSHSAPYRCVTIYWELASRSLRLSDAEQVDDCGFVQGVSRQEVERLLNASGLSFRSEEATPSTSRLLIVDSGVALTLDEDGQLHSVAANASGSPEKASR